LFCNKGRYRRKSLQRRDLHQQRVVAITPCRTGTSAIAEQLYWKRLAVNTDARFPRHSLGRPQCKTGATVVAESSRESRKGLDGAATDGPTVSRRDVAADGLGGHPGNRVKFQPQAHTLQGWVADRSARTWFPSLLAGLVVSGQHLSRLVSRWLILGARTALPLVTDFADCALVHSPGRLGRRAPRLPRPGASGVRGCRGLLIAGNILQKSSRKPTPFRCGFPPRRSLCIEYRSARDHTPRCGSLVPLPHSAARTGAIPRRLTTPCLDNKGETSVDRGRESSDHHWIGAILHVAKHTSTQLVVNSHQ
jgi:hypothetical protein